MDMGTRFPEAIPLKKVNAPAVLEAMEHFFCFVGFPNQILTDCGGSFVYALMKEAMKRLDIQHIKVTPYHPESNGNLERWHSTLKAMIIKSGKGRTDWDRLLPALCYAYRQAIHCSTGHPPFELVFGREVQGPLTLTKAQWEGEEDTVLIDIPEYITSLRSTLKQMADIVAKNDNAAKEQHKEYYNRHTQNRDVQQGDLMLRRDPVRKDKLQQPYLGPYTVKKKVSPVSYQLDNPGGKDRTVHANDLKPWKIPTASALTIAAVELEDDDEIVLPNEMGTFPTVSKARTSAEKKEAEQIISYNVELFIKEKQEERNQTLTPSIPQTRG